jgi:rod shape-determining protein MreD
MRWLRFAVLVCFAIILQAGFLSKFNIRPDLLAILLVFFAIYCNTTEAIITSFVTGFAADLIGRTMGSQMLAFGICGTLLAYLHRVIAIRKMPYQAIAIFITSFLAGFLANILNHLKGEVSGIEIYTTVFWLSMSSGIAGPILFPLFAWWMRIKMHRFRIRRKR